MRRLYLLIPVLALILAHGCDDKVTRNSSDPRLVCPGCYIKDGVYGCSMAEASERHEREEAERQKKAEEAVIEREALVRAKAAQKINELNKQTDPNKPSMKEMFYRPSDKWFDKYGDNMDTVLGFNLKIVLHNNVLMAEKISELEKRIINLEAKDPNE